jgi:hypothetical protein
MPHSPSQVTASFHSREANLTIQQTLNHQLIGRLCLSSEKLATRCLPLFERALSKGKWVACACYTESAQTHASIMQTSSL